MKGVRVRYFLFWPLALLITLPTQGQIAVPATVCKGQQFYVNDSNSDVDIIWDFCEGDLLLNPVPAQGSSDQFSIPVGTSLIKANAKWYGFICSLSNNSLFRLDFGSSLSNTSPQIVNLGNIGGLLNSPQDIEVLQFDGTYYAFVFNRSVNKLIRINFGNDIESTTATAKIILTGTGLTNGGLDVQFDDANWIVGITNATTITLVNLGTSPGNDPASQSILNTSVISGINAIGDVKFVKQENNWHAFVVGYNSRTLHRLDFGATLFVDPTTTQLTAFQFAPYGLVVEQDQGRWIMFVSTLQGNLLRLDFGALLTTSNPTYTNLGNLGTLNNLLKMDIANASSRWVGLTTNWNSKNYYLIEFPQAVCPFDKEFSSMTKDKLYAGLDGTFHISLYEEDSHGLLTVHPMEIDVLNKEAPLVDFLSSSICENVEAVLTPTSNQTLTSVSWDFGPYGSSNDYNPVVNFTSSGSYLVELKALSQNGCYNLLNKDVEIYPSINGAADFTLPSTVLCTNNAFTFFTTTPDTYDGNLSYQWFVNGAPTGTERDLQYTFTTTGPKDIKLVTSIPGCASEITKTTPSIEAGPVVDFSFTGACEDDSFSFNNLITDPVTGYLWDFGNGNTSTNPDAEQIFANYGDYPVSLTASNAAGCQNVKTRTVQVHARPVTDFLADGPPNSCSGTPTQFINQSSTPDAEIITSWLWDFGDGSAADSKDQGHTFSVAGQYNVSLTATTAAGCASTIAHQIEIHQSPSSDFSFSPACDDLPVLFAPPADNSIVDWYWEIGTSYYTSASPTHTFKSPADYPLYLEVTASNGCLSSVRKVIHVPVPLTPDFSSLKNCVGQEAVLRDITTGADPVVSREWTFDSGESFSGSPINFVFQTEQTRTVTMRVTAESGCSYSVSKQIQIVPPPVAGFTADPASGAYPLEVAFINTSSGATDYLWNFNDGTGATSTAVSPVHTFDDAGSYDVQLTASNEQGCEALYSESISTVAPLPDADIEMITLTPNADGSLKLIVTVHNKGNTILKDLPLELNFGGILNLHQVLEDPIRPGSKFNFIFSTGIASYDNIRYLCVSADVENDISPDGNKACKELEDGLYLFPAFPNPTPGMLNIEWIGNGESDIRVSLTDALGKLVLDVSNTGSGGLNRRTLDLSGLGNGIYYLVVRQGNAVSTQKIAVSGNP